MPKNLIHKVLLSILFGCGVIGIDQWTKYLVSNGVWSAPWIRPLFNEGISFSIVLPAWATWVLIFGVISWLIYDVIRRSGIKADWALVGVIIGGAISNAIDRIRFGAVFDWISVPYFSVFNIADTAIVVGLAAHILLTWRHSHEARENTRNT